MSGIDVDQVAARLRASHGLTLNDGVRQGILKEMLSVAYEMRVGLEEVIAEKGYCPGCDVRNDKAPRQERVRDLGWHGGGCSYVRFGRLLFELGVVL